MKPTEGREAAYVVSHVKDNSRITNILDYAGLFACVTPWGPKAKEDSDTLVYAPVLIQDTDTLDRTFGDPRIDPEKYRDLYAVREIVKAGFSVYIAKVPSGDPASFALLLGDASDRSTVTEEMRTDENGVLDIPGICDIPELTGGRGIPVLGFGMTFADTDKAAKYTLDEKNVVEMREKGEFGNSLFVKLSLETITEDEVEVGKIYTVHIGKGSGDQVKEIDYLASSGDSIANAFAGNAVVSGTFDKPEEDLFTAFNEWKQMDGGQGVYHGAWKISTISDLRTVYGVEKGIPLYEIVTFWLDTAKAGDFILIPFNSATDPAKDLAHLIPKLTSYGASEGSVIAIDTPDVDWFSKDIKDVVEENKCTVLMHGSDVIATSVPKGTYGTYPSSVKIVSTGTWFGMNIAVAMAIYSTANALKKEERSADMLGRFLPDMVPCKSDGVVDVPFDKSHFDDAKKQGKITFKALGSGDTRLCIANSPVPCTCLVEGVDYTVSTEVKEGKTYTRITVPRKLDSEGKPIPYEGGFPVTVKHTKPTEPYAEAVSSITDKLYLKTNLVQLKPKALKLYAMDVKLYESYDEVAPDKGIIKEARFSLPENLSNGSFISSLNSVLGSYLTFTLMEPYKEEGFDIVKSLRALVKEGKNCSQPVELSEGHFDVTVKDYQTALNEFIDPKYSGCFISELSAMVTKDGKIDHLSETANESERRALHYLIKMIAADRKDLTCVFTTPHGLSLDQACNWVNSLGEYSDLWEYGSEGATSYADQSFYCEMYWDWINVTCQKLNNGVPSKTVVVPMSPAYQVIMKGLASYRVRGTFYPVAGEQGGVLGDEVRVTRNPSQKFERDKLINYHINPIYDLGVQGIQIYGNETLNPVYSDLSAAHIARTLIYIRSRVDRYTNTQVFSLNDLSLWQRWKQYVSSMILAPLASLGGLAAYNVKMGFDTTKAELIAQRKINGVIELQFVPDAEIYTVEFVVNSSANTVESSIT